jgi:hypothetical protein
MSALYKVYGTVLARKCPEVRTIISQLRKHAPTNTDIEVCECDSGVVAISFDVYGTFATGGVLEFDELVQSLGPYATEPVVLFTNYEYEEGELVVAPTADAARAMLSSYRLEQIGPLIEDLTVEDRITLARKPGSFRLVDDQPVGDEVHPGASPI